MVKFVGITQILTRNPLCRTPEEFRFKEIINVSGASIYKSIWIEQSSGERWFAKFHSDYLNEEEILLECLANKIYAHYGINVARLAIVKLIPTNYFPNKKQMHIIGGMFHVIAFTVVPKLHSNFKRKFESD